MIRKRITNRININLFYSTDINYTTKGFPIALKQDIKIADTDFIYPIIQDIKNKKNGYGCFYIDDFQFMRFIKSPDRYINFLSKCKAIIGLDCSIYSNMPTPVKYYHLYLNCYLTNYWQRSGINVIPNISWPIGFYDDLYVDPYKNCDIVCISNIGLNEFEMHNFKNEFKIIQNRYLFKYILIYGKLFDSINNYNNIVFHKHFIRIKNE